MYRALNEYEIAQDFKVIAKAPKKPFVAPMKPAFTFPMKFGDRAEHAVEEHQDDGKYPTKGISTSPLKEIAFDKYGKKSRVIAVIDRSRLAEFNVEEFVVNDVVPKPKVFCFDDNEVVLVSESGQLPEELILEIIDLR